MPKKTFYNLSKEKRNIITESAKTMFSKHHYTKVTIDKIVYNAGISKGSFYQYFKDKEDLYEYIFTNLGDEKKTLLDNTLDEVEKLPFLDMMRALLVKSAEFENKDIETAKLKNRFLKECPQELKERILIKSMPDALYLFEEAIRRKKLQKDIHGDYDEHTAAMVLISVIYNLERLIELGKENYVEIFINSCKLLYEGMKSY